MNILSIETSCDETAVSVIKADGNLEGATFEVLGDALYSQASKHAEYGGVYPSLAKREHQENLPRLFEKAYAASGKPKIDLVAVTEGPGLEPALWQGIEFAKQISEEMEVPVAGINHMEGHLFSAFVEKKDDTFVFSRPQFPVLSLLISGGHTELVAANDWFAYTLIGRTRDDAAGEAFDKVARMLGMPYPGGPEISSAAKKAREKHTGNTIELPRPMIHDSNCDFSFSGLKTAVLYMVRDIGAISEEKKECIAEEFENAVRDVLVAKTKRALEETEAKTLIVGGGVSANTHIRKGLEKLAEEYAVSFNCPGKGLTGDNAIMIGIAAYLRNTAGKLDFKKKIEANGSLSLA